MMKLLLATALTGGAHGQVYYGVGPMLSQSAAETACVANGGNLASMHNDADHTLVNS